MLPSAEEMTALDNRAISAGTPALDLMERAGAGVADIIQADFLALGSHVVVVAGPGNNGGDGLVVARLLSKRRVKVSVLLVTAARYSPEFLAQYAMLRTLPKRLRSARLVDVPEREAPPALHDTEVIDEAGALALLLSADVIVDALLGTGHRGAPRGVVATAISAINQARAENGPGNVIAIDVPSGIDVTEGSVHGVAVKADYTVVIEFLKCGMLQHPAAEYIGRLKILSIGISEVLSAGNETGSKMRLLSLREPSLLPATRARNTHKGHMRRVLVVGGAGGMPGAAILTGMGALRAGAPLVTITRPSGSSSISVQSPPELMQLEMPGEPCREWLTRIEDWALTQKSGAPDLVLAVGPGLGTTSKAQGFIEALLSAPWTKSIPLVLDADALNLIAAGRRSRFSELALPNGVMTPHPGEMARLLGTTSAEVESARYRSAEMLAAHFQTTVVLKGASTVVMDGSASLTPDAVGAVNVCGTPWLATGGSGDVLTGVIAAFLAQHLSPFKAACGGVLVHGRAGLLAAQSHGQAASSTTKGSELFGGHPILASDIARAIPVAMQSGYAGVQSEAEQFVR
jgi:NAD(P)H-hydrate epimerase